MNQKEIRKLMRGLRVYIAKEGITQQVLADRLSVPRRTLQDWLYEKKTPHASGLTLIEQFLEGTLNV